MAANLTDIATKTRKTLRYSLYFLILIMVLRFTWGVTKTRIIPALFPPSPPPPTTGFGKLPPIPFPEPTAPLPELNYTVETPTGGLPQFPATLTVYYMPKATTTLASVDLAKKKANALGFKTKPIEISETVYSFVHPSVPSVLEMNIVTGTFSTSFNLAADPSPLNSNPPSPQTAQNIVTGLLQGAESLPKDLTVFGQPDFLKVEGQNLVQALSLSEADLIRVNLYRKAFGQDPNQAASPSPKAAEGVYPSLSRSPDKANVWFIVSGAKEKDKQIIASEFHYYPVNEDQFETYPLKTAQQALDDLKASQGYIASLGLNKEGKITIRNISLAYYDPDTLSQFYQPIIVFKGDNGFTAYVPAVSAEYYGESETTGP